MHMVTLTQAIKDTGLEKSYIIHLASAGRIEYAHDEVNDVYIVNLQDIRYHIEQVRLRRLGTSAINRVKHERLLVSANVSQATINKATAMQIVPLAKSRKTF